MHDTDTAPALVEVRPETVNRYAEADQELRERLGTSPGPEFLMSLAVESADPREISEDYLAIIVKQCGKPRPE